MYAVYNIDHIHKLFIKLKMWNFDYFFYPNVNF